MLLSGEPTGTAVSIEIDIGNLISSRIHRFWYYFGLFPISQQYFSSDINWSLVLDVFLAGSAFARLFMSLNYS